MLVNLVKSGCAEWPAYRRAYDRIAELQSSAELRQMQDFAATDIFRIFVPGVSLLPPKSCVSIAHKAIAELLEIIPLAAAYGERADEERQLLFVDVLRVREEIATSDLCGFHSKSALNVLSRTQPPLSHQGHLMVLRDSRYAINADRM